MDNIMTPRAPVRAKNSLEGVIQAETAKLGQVIFESLGPKTTPKVPEHALSPLNTPYYKFPEQDPTRSCQKFGLGG